MVNETIQTARTISDVGMMAVTAAFFLLLSATLWIMIFRWFKNIIDKTIEQHGEITQEILEEIRQQKRIIQNINNIYEGEAELRIRSMTELFFDYSIERTCRIIKQVREENHIANKEATKAKIRGMLTNMHNDRNVRLEMFTYRGRKVSEFTNVEWIDWVQDVVEKEVYAEKQNNGRAYTNVKAIYDKIQIEFNKNLKH